jgi:GT2 family glycosyltransferase
VKTAAVVVNWNSGGWLEKCLNSLPPLTEIIVVDNDSHDDSLARAAQTSNAAFVRNAENRGFAAGVNQGMRATSAPYVLVLNPDVQATAGAIDQLVRFLDANPRAGAVGGNVNRDYLPRRVATPSTLVLENLGLASHVMSPRETEVEQSAAAAILIRRDAFTAIGGFDERFYPAWYEDVDFCKRLRAGGWTVHFLRDAHFIHEGGYSAKALGRASFTEAFYKNQLRYVEKHFGFWSRLAVRLSLVFGMIGRAIAKPAHAGAYGRVIAGAFGAW